jgi:hypothetical protein
LRAKCAPASQGFFFFVVDVEEVFTGLGLGVLLVEDRTEDDEPLDDEVLLEEELLPLDPSSSSSESPPDERPERGTQDEERLEVLPPEAGRLEVEVRTPSSDPSLKELPEL